MFFTQGLFDLGVQILPIAVMGQVVNLKTCRSAHGFDVRVYFVRAMPKQGDLNISIRAHSKGA
ncbi:MAG: hypothetical protein AB8B71_01055 [Paracoccaceae bacterium]